MKAWLRWSLLAGLLALVLLLASNASLRWWKIQAAEAVGCMIYLDEPLSILSDEQEPQEAPNPSFWQTLLRGVKEIDARHPDRGDPPLTDADLVPLGRLHEVRIVQLDGKITDAGLVAFRDCYQIEAVNLSGAAINGTGLRHFARSRPTLRRIRVDETRLSKAGFETLLAYDLEVLGIRGFQDLDLALLARLPSLKVLDVAESALTDADVVHLQPLSHLEELSIDSTPVGNAFLEKLATLPMLASVNFARTRIDDGAVDILAKMTALRRVTAGDRISPSGIARLAALRPDVAVEFDGQE